MHLFFRVLTILVFIISCAHMRSGHYVQLGHGESINDLAKKYGVSKSSIRANNKQNLNSGDWVFIPLKRGIMSRGIASLGSSFSNIDPTQFMSTGRFMWPVPASKKLSSKFGHRWGRPHNGIDIAASRGTHFLASDSGVVIYSGNGLSGFGNMIVIKHSDSMYTIYAHNHRNYVRKGETVARGQVIGQVGSTGRSSGPHLHFEIRHGDRPLNPSAFFRNGSGSQFARN